MSNFAIPRRSSDAYDPLDDLLSAIDDNDSTVDALTGTSAEREVHDSSSGPQPLEATTNLTDADK